MPDEAVALSWEGLNRLDDAYKASTAPTKFSTTWSRRFGPFTKNRKITLPPWKTPKNPYI